MKHGTLSVDRVSQALTDSPVTAAENSFITVECVSLSRRELQAKFDNFSPYSALSVSRKVCPLGMCAKKDSSEDSYLSDRRRVTVISMSEKGVYIYLYFATAMLAKWVMVLAASVRVRVPSAQKLLIRN